MCLVIFLIVGFLLYRHFGFGGGANTPRKNPALDTLMARYARGEINADVFNERRRALEQ